MTILRDEPDAGTATAFRTMHDLARRRLRASAPHDQLLFHTVDSGRNVDNK
jgi:hypothetical protein